MGRQGTRIIESGGSFMAQMLAEIPGLDAETPVAVEQMVIHLHLKRLSPKGREIMLQLDESSKGRKLTHNHVIWRVTSVRSLSEEEHHGHQGRPGPAFEYVLEKATEEDIRLMET